jgi:hypothetical protein
MWQVCRSRKPVKLQGLIENVYLAVKEVKPSFQLRWDAEVNTGSRNLVRFPRAWYCEIMELTEYLPDFMKPTNEDVRNGVIVSGGAKVG